MNREKTKSFKITEKEMKDIEAYCKAKDIRFSQFVRESLMNRIKKQRISYENGQSN